MQESSIERVEQHYISPPFVLSAVVHLALPFGVSALTFSFFFRRNIDL
jgi:hypothetical protein